MSVKIIDFTTYEYVHDDAPGGSHGGTLDPATVIYGTNPDGSPNENVIAVPCPFPDCGSVSYWPPGGGADALMGQQLHVLKQHEAMSSGVQGRGAPAGLAEAAEAVKQRVIATDGEARWVLDEAAMAALEARSG